MNEIREFGDGKTIVLYSDNRQLITRLSNSAKCFKTIPYEQEQPSKKRIALIGADLYFPKRLRPWLERQMKGTF